MIDDMRNQLPKWDSNRSENIIFAYSKEHEILSDPCWERVEDLIGKKLKVSVERRTSDRFGCKIVIKRFEFRPIVRISISVSHH